VHRKFVKLLPEYTGRHLIYLLVIEGRSAPVKHSKTNKLQYKIYSQLLSQFSSGNNSWIKLVFR